VKLTTEREMIEFRWIVPEGTFIPGEYPKLQYRIFYDVVINGTGFAVLQSKENVRWEDIKTVVMPNV
jgi:hypothetical protein